MTLLWDRSSEAGELNGKGREVNFKGEGRGQGVSGRVFSGNHRCPGPGFTGSSSETFRERLLPAAAGCERRGGAPMTPLQYFLHCYSQRNTPRLTVSASIFAEENARQQRQEGALSAERAPKPKNKKNKKSPTPGARCRLIKPNFKHLVVDHQAVVVLLEVPERLW